MSKQHYYYVYMLLCKNKSIYTGITDNVGRRFADHKKGAGARYTRAFGVVKILYTEKLKSKSAALKREYEIKTWKRREKVELIRSRTLKK